MWLIALDGALTLSILVVWIRSLREARVGRRFRLTSCGRRSAMTSFPERREEMTGGTRRPRSFCAAHWERFQWTEGRTGAWRPAADGERCRGESAPHGVRSAMGRAVRIYVYAQDEFFPVWAPVWAERLYGSVYRILAQAKSERWQFEPGDVVCAEWIESETGPILAATSQTMEGL